MIHCPMVLSAFTKHRLSVGNIGVLEREFADATGMHRPHVALGIVQGFDGAPGHDASGPDAQAIGSGEEFIEARGSRPHELSASIVVVMMARPAQVGETGSIEFARQFARQVGTVGKTGDLIEPAPSLADDAQDHLRQQQRFAAAGYNQTLRAASCGELEVAPKVDYMPVTGFRPQSANR